MPTVQGRVHGSASDFLEARVVRWRTGSREGQGAVLLALSLLVVLVTVVSLARYNFAPMVSFFIPVLIGTLTLRFKPLAVLMGVAAIGVTVTLMNSGLNAPRVSSAIVMGLAGVIMLAGASRIRSGLPGPLSEAMLLDLRDRLYDQGRVPPLPEGWQSQSAMKSAGGAEFAGDFMVAGLSPCGNVLEMVLVDVCGKGVAAGTQSLHLAGALGGLIGELPPTQLFSAANRFLLRQDWTDGFATAIHVIVNLDTGEFSIINAGHPPALLWNSALREWTLDGARGTALGITPDADVFVSHGTLADGDALLFYTDGVIERPGLSMTDGIAWLTQHAATVVARGFENAPQRILAGVTRGDDDRAVLILSRASATNF